MTASNFHSKPSVPAAFADLDPDVVTEVLARHACNVTDAAADLAVPASDLRRLLWANPKLQDAAFEVVEGRLDLAEKNIGEALRSDDPRMRVAASMFTLRNSARAKRRGWITTAAASVDVNINQAAGSPVFTWRPMPSELRTEEARAKEAHRLAEVQRALAEGHKVVQLSWRNSAGGGDADDGDGGDAEGETIERDGRRIRMPRYDNGRHDEGDCFEGEVSTPPAMIAHAPEPAVVEPEPAASPPMEALSVVPEPESAAVRYERERVDAWIRNRLINYPLASCLLCRKPIIAGQDWQEVSNGEARARFHRTCHAEWRTEREAAARQALGLEG